MLREIALDLAKPVPMMRLVQGDVGSGKTLIAAGAALQAIGNGYQVAIMAPTEILAEQHWRNFCQWFEPLDISMEWLSGRTKGSKRANALARIASGEASLVIGTHALFQDDVAFARLGLAIVDEQHRFGVHQRLALTRKTSAGAGPPAPVGHDGDTDPAHPVHGGLRRPGLLDHRRIAAGPHGGHHRRWWTAAAATRSRRESRRLVRAGRQAYWVCTLIEESDVLQAQAAEATAAELRLALPHLAIGLIHGRLKPRGKRSDDGGVQERRAGAAGGHHRHRGRGGRAQCQPDDYRKSRAPGPGATAPTARQGGPRRAGQPLRPAVPDAVVGQRQAAADGICGKVRTASISPRKTWSCAAPAKCSAPGRPA